MKTKYIHKIAQSLKANNLEAILVTPSEELQFIADINPYLCERFQGLFIKQDASCFYICNLLNADEFREIFGPEIEIFSWSDSDGFIDATRTAFTKHGLLGKTVGVNTTSRAFNVLTIMNEMDIQFCDGRYILEAMRIIKTPEEMQALREAAAIVDDSFAELLEYLRPGLTEAQIMEKMKDIFARQGIFECNVLACAGANSSYPHYCGNEGVVQYGDVVLMDWGCRHKNMWSDMSRTVFIGEASPHQSEIYNIVLEAQTAAEKAAVKGAFVPDVDKTARDIITAKGYGDAFITRLGHGIGYSLHEGPSIVQTNHINLDTGMAFSIEPGIYLAGELGVRIEDIVLIGPNGTEILNQAPKELIVVPAPKGKE